MPSNNAIARARTLCICGSRSFADYGLLCRSIDAALVEWDPSDISQVVHGGALGADRLGGRWARERGLRVAELVPDWRRHGKTAGYFRNAGMVLLADYLIAFWDGQSKGTAHSIQLAREKGIPLAVVRFDRKRSPIHLETQTDLIGELRSASFYDREQGLKQL